jgi:hypothetical protein
MCIICRTWYQYRRDNKQASKPPDSGHERYGWLLSPCGRAAPREAIVPMLSMPQYAVSPVAAKLSHRVKLIRNRPDRDGSRDQDKHSTQDAPSRMDEQDEYLSWVGCLGSTDVVDRCLEWLHFDGWLQHDPSCFSCFEVAELADR